MPIELGTISAGVIACGVIVGVAAHLLTKSREKETRNANDSNEAALYFRQSFSTAIRELRSGDSDTYILQEQFPIHEEAMEKFVFNLSGREKERFREAWQRYEDYCKERTGDDAMMQHAMAVLHDRDIGTAKLNSHVLTLIEELLEFAKYKK